MFSTLVALITIVTGPGPVVPDVPGDGLSLVPSAERGDTRPVASRPDPGRGSPGVGTGAIAFQSVVALIGAAGGIRPRTSERLAPGSGPTVVVIPGFGSPRKGTFDQLLVQAGISDERVHRFDWRWVTGDRDHATAARWAHTGRAADTLESFLRRVADPTKGIYLLGHSKGGALIAELIARWDEDPARSVRAVTGAMLLDPPIASGELGRLQRVGVSLGMPNNGGYDPVDCGWIRCQDTRQGLGVAAGIDVVVIRNPDAVVTSFTDEPPGLRILDLEDDGGGPALDKVWERGSVLGRVAEAHHSPLVHTAVAACLRAELEGGDSCAWEAGAEHGPRKVRSFVEGGGGSSAY